MKFAFDDDQLAFRDAVRELLEKECSATQLRDAWTNQTGRVPGLWDQLVEMGVVGMLASEADGGLGMSMVDLVLILEETGRFAVPEPIIETAAFGVPLLGRTDITVSTGHTYLPWADTADVLIAAFQQYDPATTELIPHASVDGARRLFELRGEGTPVAGDTDGAFARALIGVAAQLCGLSDRMLTMTADYVKERKQFGVAVGSFQAVKHHLANARVALEFARPLAYRAAVTIDGTHASMALAKASDAAAITAKAALQCHGAIGYTTEFDLHLYMKRAWALMRAYGDARYHRSRVAEAIL
jgi:alkylation response protein AidB-like acyl-CoA dehydrogenase